MMTEHIALLEKEIEKLKINLARAKDRPGVKEDELTNLDIKLQLKNEMVIFLKRANDLKRESCEGCIYYRRLDPSYRIKGCHYLYDTWERRECPPENCTKRKERKDT